MFETDRLTGAIASRAFLDHLAAQASRAAEAEAVLSIGFADLDEFSALNERLGRKAGDQALVCVADALRTVAPEDAAVGRIGSDHFGVLLPGKEPEEAFLLLEKARAEVEMREEAASGATISIGVASLPKDGRTGPEILRQADAGLYRAKGLGRNRVCFPPDEPMVAKTSHYTPTQLDRLSRLAVRKEVKEADLLREALDDFLFKHQW